MGMVFWAIVAIGFLIAMRDWRAGLIAMVVVGLLQDPARKMVPGAPIIYTMAFAPIYLACLLGFFSQSRGSKNLLQWFPRLRTPAALFTLVIFFSLTQTFSYGPGAFIPGLIGAFSYFCIVPAILLGFFYPQRDSIEFDRVLLVYTLAVGAMLIGVVLDQAGFTEIIPGLRPMREGDLQLRWTEGYVVHMYSGFFRSSEIMGWHAVTMTMLALYLALRQPRFMFLWLPLVGWGVYCVILSGRRKMFVALLAYLLALLYLERGRVRPRLLAISFLAGIVIVPAILTLVSEEHLVVARTGVEDIGERANITAVSGPLWLWREVGLFGFGVGTKTQGTQHFQMSIRTPLAEGGFEKVMIEVGLLGIAAFLALMIALGLCVWKCLAASIRAPDEVSLTGPLGAILVANLMMFTSSFQIFGDPMILVILGLFTGVVLSHERLRRTAFGVRDQVARRYRRQRPSRYAPEPQIATTSGPTRPSQSFRKP